MDSDSDSAESSGFGEDSDSAESKIFITESESESKPKSKSKSEPFDFSKIHENSSFQLKSVTKIEAVAVYLRNDQFGHSLGPFVLSFYAL